MRVELFVGLVGNTTLGGAASSASWPRQSAPRHFRAQYRQEIADLVPFNARFDRRWIQRKHLVPARRSDSSLVGLRAFARSSLIWRSAACAVANSAFTRSISRDVSNLETFASNLLFSFAKHNVLVGHGLEPLRQVRLWIRPRLQLSAQGFQSFVGQIHLADEPFCFLRQLRFHTVASSADPFNSEIFACNSLFSFTNSMFSNGAKPL